MPSTVLHHCPHCGSTHVVPSRRRGVEWLAPLFGFFSFRCRNCTSIFFEIAPAEAAVGCNPPCTPAGCH